MKNITVKAAGKGWNARVIVAQDVQAFISDKAHAIEGLSSDENTAQLKAIHAKCVEAVKEADAPDPMTSMVIIDDVKPGQQPAAGDALDRVIKDRQQAPAVTVPNHDEE